MNVNFFEVLVLMEHECMGPNWTRRGVYPWSGRKDVHNRWACDRVWRERQCDVWIDLLDNHIVLTGEHRSPLRNLLNNTVGANCVRPSASVSIEMIK